MNSVPQTNILLIWDRLGDYHRSRAHELAKRNNNRVFTADLGNADPFYKWESTRNANHFVLSTKPVQEKDFWARVKAFKKIINEQRINIIGISGYGRMEYVAFLILAKWLGIKTILFAESWYGDNKIINKLKGIFLKQVAAGFLVSGIKAQKHFQQKLSIPGHFIKTGYSTVDNRHFICNTTPVKHPTLLCVARFSPEKNLSRLIAAFASSKAKQNFALQIIGDGPLKSVLTAEIQSLKTCTVKLTDWLSYEDLPAVYQEATAFILPSTFEPWGLVVNEAMAAGLPILASEQCGCVPDLVDQQNGWVFDANNKEDIIRKLNAFAEASPSYLEQKSKSSKEKIKGFTPQLWANTFMELAWL